VRRPFTSDLTYQMFFPFCIGGYRSSEGRDEFLRYYKAAIDISSSAISRMESISRDSGVFLVIGVIERDRGTL
jgi:imidazole glycerol phosphate synthase subunit HisF